MERPGVKSKSCPIIAQLFLCRKSVRSKFGHLRLRESQLSLVSLRLVGYAVLDTGFCVRMGTTMGF